MIINNLIILESYLSYLILPEKLEKTLYMRIIDHIKKSDILILIALNIYINILNLISIFLFFSFLNNLSTTQFLKLKKIDRFLPFLPGKVDDFLSLIAHFHIHNSEKLKRINTNQVNFNPEKNDNIFFKYIIIGSGPSGAITAKKINERFPGEVLLIEKGSNFDLPITKHPGDEFKKKWYRGGINASYFPNIIGYSAGFCFGGGSEINSGLFHEPDEEFLHRWRTEHKTLELDSSILSNHLCEIKTLTSHPNSHSNFYKKFKYTEKKDHEVEALNRFIDDKGNKNSMSQNYLKDYLSKSGKVSLETEVLKIKKGKEKWEISVLKAGKKINIYCEFLFLCCGSIFTNDLLLKSKIIPKKKRKLLESFKFHPMIKYVGVYKEDMQKINDDVISLQNMSKYPKFIIGNASSSIQFLMAPFIKNKSLKDYIKKNWTKMKIFHTTFSLGKGKIIRIPFFKDPFIFYFLNNREKNLMINSMKYSMEFIRDTDAEKVFLMGNFKDPFIDLKNITNSLKKIKKINLFQISSVHILGGVTMGEGKNCIADSFGKVGNVDNLYVNDSSLINTNLLKNPQGTIMSIALRNVDHFLKNI